MLFTVRGLFLLAKTAFYRVLEKIMFSELLKLLRLRLALWREISCKRDESKTVELCMQITGTSNRILFFPLATAPGFLVEVIHQRNSDSIDPEVFSIHRHFKGAGRKSGGEFSLTIGSLLRF
jgi:hypothetical protein